MASEVWENDSVQLSCCSFCSLLRATNSSLSLQESKDSSLPQPEPRVSGCKWDFTCWPFKRHQVSTRLLSLHQNSCWFSQPIVRWASLPGSGVLGWRTRLGAETPLFSGGAFVAELFLQNLSCCSLFLKPLLFYQSPCDFLCKSLVILVKLLFSWSSVANSGWLL